MEPPRRTRLRGPIQGSLKLSRFVWGGPSPSGTHQRLPPTNPQTKYGAFPLPWFCCHGLGSTVRRSDSRSALTHFAGSLLIRLGAPRPPASWHPSGLFCWGGDGSLLFPRWLCQRSTPSTPLGSSGLPLQALHPFPGLRPGRRDSAPSCSLRSSLTTRQASLHAADRWLAPSHGGLDPALRRPGLPKRRRATTKVTWFLLRPDLHRLVIVNFQDAISPGLLALDLGCAPSYTTLRPTISAGAIGVPGAAATAAMSPPRSERRG